MIKSKIKNYIILHFLFLFYSLTGIFSKLAGKQNFLSINFCFFYGCVILILCIYAIAWQQLIKIFPLTVAFANKAITIVWGIIWGKLFFEESLSPQKIIGAILVVSGVILYALADSKKYR